MMTATWSKASKQSSLNSSGKGEKGSSGVGKSGCKMTKEIFPPDTIEGKKKAETHQEVLKQRNNPLWGIHFPVSLERTSAILDQMRWQGGLIKMLAGATVGLFANPKNVNEPTPFFFNFPSDWVNVCTALGIGWSCSSLDSNCQYESKHLPRSPLVSTESDII